MKTGFTTGMVIGGVVGAMIYMVSNGDMNMKRIKKRIMRMGKDMCKSSRRLMSNIGDMMH
jgi:hypothetical protein